MDVINTTIRELFLSVLSVNGCVGGDLIEHSGLGKERNFRRTNRRSLLSGDSKSIKHPSYKTSGIPSHKCVFQWEGAAGAEEGARKG